MSFDSLGLNPSLLSAIAKTGYSTPTPVQTQAIPAALSGADLMVSSSTGSGKTAAFMLPALQHILNHIELSKTSPLDRAMRSSPKILVLTPTRELAQQVTKACETYGRGVKNLRTCTVLGGVPYGLQIKLLKGPLDILIATPGRLIDHIQSGKANLRGVDILVLDEADRMLDMGFIEDIETIAAAIPAQRQTLLFSATFAGPIAKLAQKLLRDPQRIELATAQDVHANITQRLLWADDARHKEALLDHIICQHNVQQAIIFTSTQRDADSLAERLEYQGHQAAALHGGMPQGKRNRTLHNLRTGRLRVLVATDVAARGIDVPTISHVINYGLPMNPEDYVHRIGRTGRAGRDGLAYTIAEHRDMFAVRRIERFTTQRIEVEIIAGLEPQKPLRQTRSEGGADRRPRSGSARFGNRREGAAAPAQRNDRHTRNQTGTRSFGERTDNANLRRTRSEDRTHANRAPAGSSAGFNRNENTTRTSSPNGNSRRAVFDASAPRFAERSERDGPRPPRNSSGGDRPRFNKDGQNRSYGRAGR